MKMRRFLTVTVGVLVLSVGLVLANYGGGVTPATAADITKDNHTLRWDTNNPSASRFTTAFPGAVLDKNTGLVWEKQPDATGRVWGVAPGAANLHCINREIGGTKGWRLPSIPELASLIDPSVAPPGPTLPAGHPFNVVSLVYWSASTLADFPAGAWDVNFGSGLVETNGKATNGFSAWCVRGPMQESVY